MVRRLTGARRPRKPAVEGPEAGSPGGEPPLSTDLDANIAAIKEAMAGSSDLIVRRLVIGGQVEGAIVFLAGMVDNILVHQAVVEPLMQACLSHAAPQLDLLETSVVSAGAVKRVESTDSLLDGVSGGFTAILIAGVGTGLVVATQGWEKRGIEEPRSEVVVRGPRESFSESLQASLALVRRRIRDPLLTVERLRIGRRTRSEVAMVYLRGVAKQAVVEEVRTRLNRIDTDAILGSGMIEQLIEDEPLSPFPTVGYSERPDTIAGKVLEGRIAILLDGCAEALTVPHLFVENFQSPQDYYVRATLAAGIRLVRYIGFAVSILAPAIYVALATYHQELIPTSLLLTIAKSQEGVPFPTVVEAIGLGLVFEILREAGVRLPRPIGQAVSIVGVLVVGQAAVSAGFVDATMVIIVSMTALASFLNPTLTEAGLIFRLVLTIVAGALGGFGVVLGLFAALIHLNSTRSFGSPYLAPVAPVHIRSLLQDALIRAPIWAMRDRPGEIATGERQGRSQRPRPPRRPRESGNQ